MRRETLEKLKRMSNRLAEPGKLYVCMHCGRTSRDSAGMRAISKEWGKKDACSLHAVEIWESLCGFNPGSDRVHYVMLDAEKLYVRQLEDPLPNIPPPPLPNGLLNRLMEQATPPLRVRPPAARPHDPPRWAFQEEPAAPTGWFMPTTTTTTGTFLTTATGTTAVAAANDGLLDILIDDPEDPENRPF